MIMVTAQSGNEPPNVATAGGQETKMPALVFDTCCGCIELRTGSLIIGYLNLIGEIILIGLSIAGVAAGSYLSAHGDDKDAQNAGIAVTAISAIFVLIMVFFLAFTIVLLVGVHKGKRGHVKAYLIVATICLVLSIITFLGSFAGSVKTADIISKLISIALSIYFLLVIRSYYYKMDERKPAVYNAA